MPCCEDATDELEFRLNGHLDVAGRSAVSNDMKRVLIVDDDDAIRESLAELLRDNYEVSVARDGLEALDVVATERIDAIVLDLMMPRLDGAGFKHELDARGLKIPILIASAGTEIARRAAELGVADYVGKPFDLEDLEAKLDRLMRRVSSSGSSGSGGDGSDRDGPPTDSGRAAATVGASSSSIRARMTHRRRAATRCTRRARRARARHA